MVTTFQGVVIFTTPKSFNCWGELLVFNELNLLEHIPRYSVMFSNSTHKVKRNKFLPDHSS